MATNEGWPEAFGFSIAGGDPCIISKVEDGGSAQEAGLQVGDLLIEVDGEEVRHWSTQEVVRRARQAQKVPPSILVMSRVRSFKIPLRGSPSGFGITLRGDNPVYVRTVEFDSLAHATGLRSGDLLLEVNGRDVRSSGKREVQDLLKRSTHTLELTVVTGGLDTPLFTPATPSRRNAIRMAKAKQFHEKVQYYLCHDEVKRVHLLSTLKIYARNRNVEVLGRSLNLLLETDIERRLLGEIRGLINPRHHAKFDSLLSSKSSSSNSPSFPSSLSWSSLTQVPRSSSRRNGPPYIAGGEARLIHISRGSGGFGFSLSGNAPVFIRSVDAKSPAAMAGLKPSDYILEINGLDVRDATHSHVVRLLKGSGSVPTLLVSASSPLSSRPSLPTSSSATSLSSVDSSTTSTRRQSTKFRRKMEHILLSREQKHIMEQLKKYTHSKDMEQLVNGLSSILSDPHKTILFHYICQLLPKEAQEQFDKMASTAVARRTRASSSSTTEPPVDMLYRAQASRLEQEMTMLLPETSIGVIGASQNPSLSSTHYAGEHVSPGDKATVNTASAAMPTYVATASATPLTAPTQGGMTLATPSRSLADSLREGANKMKRSSGSPPSLDSSMPTPTIALSPPAPPPPPLGTPGSIPAPPPLPGGMASGSRPHLKRVNWEKLNETQIEGTIWNEMSGLEDALEYYELDRQFSSQLPKEQQHKKTTYMHDTKPKIMEARKAYNISILLAHLKLSLDQIRREVLTCNLSSLSEQTLTHMLTFAPDKKECLELARCADSPAGLCETDRFSLEMSTIPCYQERLKGMIFKLQFPEKLAEIKSDLEVISSAAVTLQQNKNFKKILELVLAVGNYMNAGNWRVAGAQGFRIHFLLQLKELRTTDKKSSLLHFLVNTAERKFPQAVDFLDELTVIKKAARVSGQMLEIEVSKMRTSLNDLHRTLTKLSSQEATLSPQDHFLTSMAPFAGKAEEELNHVVIAYSKMRTEFGKVAKFFGEDPAQCPTDEFFGTFANFMLDFERAVEDNRKEREWQLEQERRRKQRGRRLSFRRQSKRSSISSVPDMPGEPSQRASATVREGTSEEAGRDVGQEVRQVDFRSVLRPLGSQRRGSEMDFDELMF